MKNIYSKNYYLFNKYFRAKVNKLGIFSSFIYNCKDIEKNNDSIKLVDDTEKLNLGMVYKIISISKISHTLAKGRVMNYKVVSCCGNGTGWIGLGTYSNNKFFNTVELSKVRSMNDLYIFKSNCMINDTDFFKYKGCKIKFINRIRDKFKLMKVVNSVHSVLGQNRFNLISFNSDNSNILVKLLVNSLVSFR